MAYKGDFIAGDAVDFKFTSLSTAGSGAPASLTSGAVTAYKDNSTGGSTAGLTLTVDFGGTTGLNHVRLQTTAASSFYTAGSAFQVILSGGGVGSVSLVGYVLGDFSISARSNPRRDDYTTGRAGNLDRLDKTVAGSTELPANFAQLVVSTSGIADVNVQQWRGTAPSTYNTWLASTGAPTNFAQMVVSTSGIVDGNVQQWRGAQPTTYNTWLASTGAPTNFAQLVVSTSGIADANVQQWRAAQPTTYFAWLKSSEVKAEVVAALSSDKYAAPSTMPGSSSAPLSDKVGWLYQLARAELVQNSTRQTTKDSTGGTLFGANLVASTSQVTREAWSS